MVAQYIARRIEHPSCIFHVGLGAAREVAIFHKFFAESNFLAIEACPEFHLRWLNNDFRYPGIILWAAALDTSGMIVFNDRKRHRGAASIYPKRDGEDLPIYVPAVTIEQVRDSFRDFIGNDALLWVDCEGAELRAISGGGPLAWARWLNVEMTERDMCEVVRRPYSAEKVHDLAVSLGFEWRFDHSYREGQKDSFYERVAG